MQLHSLNWSLQYVPFVRFIMPHLATKMAQQLPSGKFTPNFCNETALLNKQLVGVDAAGEICSTHGRDEKCMKSLVRKREGMRPLA
jgi:hypothetical protein